MKYSVKCAPKVKFETNNGPQLHTDSVMLPNPFQPPFVTYGLETQSSSLLLEGLIYRTFQYFWSAAWINILHPQERSTPHSV